MSFILFPSTRVSSRDRLPLTENAQHSNLGAGPLIQSIFEKAMSHKMDFSSKLQIQASGIKAYPIQSMIIGACALTLIFIASYFALNENREYLLPPGADLNEDITPLYPLLAGAGGIAFLLGIGLGTAGRHFHDNNPSFIPEAISYAGLLKAVGKINHNRTAQNPAAFRALYYDPSNEEFIREIKKVFTNICGYSDERFKNSFFAALNIALTRCNELDDNAKRDVIILALHTVVTNKVRSLFTGEKSLREINSSLKAIGINNIWHISAFQTSNHFITADAHERYIFVALRPVLSVLDFARDNQVQNLKVLAKMGLDLTLCISKPKIPMHYISRSLLENGTLLIDAPRPLNLFELGCMRLASEVVKYVLPILNKEPAALSGKAVVSYIKLLRVLLEDMQFCFNDFCVFTRAQHKGSAALMGEKELIPQSLREEAIFYLFLYSQVVQKASGTIDSEFSVDDSEIKTETFKKRIIESSHEGTIVFAPKSSLISAISQNRFYLTDPGKAILAQSAWNKRLAALKSWKQHWQLLET